MSERRFDAVFEGGGVKGIALVGALSALEARGYRPVNIAGTSAGAIVGALAAAGYRASELETILKELDFRSFTDASPIGQIPILGPPLSVLEHLGLYEGEFFLRFMRERLAEKGKTTFGDLVLADYADDPRYRYKLKVVAADLSRGKMLVLPDDIVEYGMKPDDLPIALAVRMSMSIPFFFRPVELRRPPDDRKSFIVDGGLLSNFPVSLFDSPTVPEWPTFGFHLAPQAHAEVQHEIEGPISMLKAMIGTLLNAHDARYIETHDFVRTIVIDPLGVSPVDFALSGERKQALFDSGVRAAEEFLRTWDFERYKAKYRQGKPPPRRRDLTS